MSSPKSPEINEEMQEDDVSLQQQQQQQQQQSVPCSSSSNQETPIPQNPYQDFPIPQNSNQNFSIPHNPDQDIQNPQNPDKDISNRQNPQQEESRWWTGANVIIAINQERRRKRQLERLERRSRPRRAQRRLPPMQPIPEDDVLEESDDDDDYDDDNDDDDDDGGDNDYNDFDSDTFMEMEDEYDDFPPDESWESMLGCILFASTSITEEEDDVMTINYVFAYIQEGNSFPQIWEDYQLLCDYISSIGESINLEVLGKKLDMVKKKFFRLMKRIRQYPDAALTDYDDLLHRFGTEVWGSERPSSEEEAVDNTELDAMYARCRAEVISLLTQESSHARNEINESGLQQRMQRLQLGENRRSQQEVEAQIRRQNPDGNMGTRGASGSSSGGGNEGANAGGSEDTDVGASESVSVSANEGANVGAHGVGIDDGNEGDTEGGS